MAQNRTWTLTETGQTRSWTLTQSSESKTFSVTPSTATRNFTVSPGVGPTGPNEVSTSTSTDITGILKGDGSTVSAAVADTDYQSVPAEGAFADGDKTKLDGIETAATADQTAAEILTAIKTVDGTGSGLDADTVDGKEAAAFAELATSNDFTATNTFSGGLTVFGVDGTTAGQLRLNSTTLGGGTAITPTGTAFRSISTPDSSGTLALTAQSDGTIQSSDLDFANSTDIGADLADADEVLVSDGGGNTTRRKSALSRFWTYIKAKIESVTLSTLDISGDVTVGGEVDITPYSTNDSQLKVGSAEVQSYSLNLGWVGENLYFDGAKFAYRSTGAAGMLVFYGNEGQFRFAPSGTAGTDTSLTDSAQFKVHEDGSVALGGSMNGQVGQYANAALLVDSSSNVTMSGDLTVDTDTLVVDASADRVGINAGATPAYDFDMRSASYQLISAYESGGTGRVRINAGGQDVNFRVYGLGDNELIFTDGGLDQVGIGTTSLSGKSKLTIDGDVGFSANSGTWDGATIAGDQTMSGDVSISSDLSIRGAEVGNASLTVHPQGTTYRGIAIKTPASQTAQTLYIEDSSGNTRAGFDSVGNYFMYAANNSQGLYMADQSAPSGTEKRASFTLRGGWSEALYINAGRNASNTAGDLVLASDVTGNVGIGITGPTTKLDVNGTLSFSTANSGTWDGATIAGDQTMSGQLELTGQSATGDDSAMTRSLTDTRHGLVYRALKGSNEDRTTTTTLAQDTDLTVSSVDVGYYRVELYIRAADVSADSGIKWALNGGATFTDFDQARGLPFSASTAWGFADLKTGEDEGPFSGVDRLQLTGAIEVTVAGSIYFEWAQNTSTANATRIYEESHLILTKLD
jgi:hypothetical protein